MRLLNLQRYTPDEFSLGDDVAYFKDETGKDLYNSLPGFTKKFSLAIDHDTGVVFSISDDASKLPWARSGTTIVDVDVLPEGCDIFGGWVFDGERLIPRVFSPKELADQAQRKKDELLAVATSVIAPLQDAADLGIATDEELKKLALWKGYRVEVARLDATSPGKIAWPIAPDR